MCAINMNTISMSWWMVQLSIVLIWNLLFPISFHFGVVSAKKHPQHAATMSTGSPDCFHQLLFWVESSLVSCLIVFERSSNLCLFILNDPMARDISLCFLKIMREAFPLLTQLANWRKFSKCVTKAQLGHLRYGVSTLVLSLQLRCLCGRVYQCPDWAGVALKSTINRSDDLGAVWMSPLFYRTHSQRKLPNSLQYSPLIILVTGGSAIFTIDHGSGLKIRMSQQIKVSQFQNSFFLDDFFTN